MEETETERDHSASKPSVNSTLTSMLHLPIPIFSRAYGNFKIIIIPLAQQYAPTLLLNCTAVGLDEWTVVGLYKHPGNIWSVNWKRRADRLDLVCYGM